MQYSEKHADPISQCQQFVLIILRLCTTFCVIYSRAHRYIFIRTSTSYFIFKAARTERAMSFIVAHHAILLALFQLCFPNVAQYLKISQKVSFCNNAEDETCKVVFKQCASSSVFMTVFPCIINKIFPHFFQLQWRFF